MKKFTKTMSLAMCLALAAGTFSGCGKEKAQDGMTTVTMWTADGGSKAVMADLVNEFNKTIGKENNVILDYEVKEGNLKEQIELALTTNLHILPKISDFPHRRQALFIRLFRLYVLRARFCVYSYLI